MTRLAALLATVILVSSAPPARAYEFEIDATTIGQGYQVRWFRPGGDVLLNRRRFTQTLGLGIWDILAPRVDPGYPGRVEKAPFQLYFTSHLRFDHDFGELTRGEVTYTSAGVPVTAPATTVVPELASGDLALDVLYAYLGGRRVAGFVDFELGRQLHVGTLDWVAFDGATVRAHTPWHVAVEGRAGWVVRGELAGLVGSATHEPDGTGSAQCGVFDESQGLWTDAAECAQRKQLLPMFGGSVQSEGLRAVQARVEYRRAMSRTPMGLYPDPDGDVPRWGVNEEKLSAGIRGSFLRGGIAPWGAARWNLLVGQIDEAQAGIRLATATHSLTPEWQYSLPTFDGDSIFNVFSSEPYHDLRLTYELWPGRGALRTYARGFARRYESTCRETPGTPDGDCLAAGQAVEPRVYSRGGGVGGRWAFGHGGRLRLDLFFESGYGGLRAGADTSGRFRLTDRLALEGRLTAIRFDENLIDGLDGNTFGIQGGGLWTLTPGIAVHLLVEENTRRFTSSQLRAFAVLDLAFRPEL